MIYHYTDRDSAREAIASRVLRACPVAVYDTPFGAFDGAPTVLGSAVWFTVRETPSPTVVIKLTIGGWPVHSPGVIWRFGVADEVAPDDLQAWATARGHGAAPFGFMVATAELVAESWEEWRLSSVDVPRELWSAVESWDGDKWTAETPDAPE